MNIDALIIEKSISGILKKEGGIKMGSEKPFEEGASWDATRARDRYKREINAYVKSIKRDYKSGNYKSAKATIKKVREILKEFEHAIDMCAIDNTVVNDVTGWIWHGFETTITALIWLLPTLGFSYLLVELRALYRQVNAIIYGLSTGDIDASYLNMSINTARSVYADLVNIIDRLERECDAHINEEFDGIDEDSEVFTEGALATLFGKTVSEMYHLSVPPAGVKLIATGLNTAINATTAKWFLARAKNYTLLHPEITPISDFEEEKYSLPEAIDKFNIKFQFANKWAEKINTRVDVKVFSFHKIPQFAIAYAGKTNEHKYNSEFVWITNQFKKYDDFYTACAHCKVKLGHPAINRMVKKMLADWKKTREQSKKNINESVEEAVMNDTYLDKVNNLREAIKHGIITEENATPYFEEMELASVKIDNEWY
jgi:hypothetical protein